MKNILVVNVNWFGDVVFSSPVFRALKEMYPQARINCLAVPRVKAVLESIPAIDEVIIYDEKGRHRPLWMKLKMAWVLRGQRFDAVFLLRRSLTRSFLMWAAGIPVRVGYVAKGRGVFLTHKIKNLVGQAGHRSDHYLNVIESFGVKVRDRATILMVDPPACMEARDILQQHGIREQDAYVVIHPAGNWDLKRWPKENFVLLIKQLIITHGLKVVITGAPQEKDLAGDIASAAGDGLVNLAGITSLKQLLALFKQARVVVSADSGPLHLANSVGAHVIGLFGPTRPEVTGPRGPGRVTILQHDVGCNRSACYFEACPDNICMQAVTVQEVLTAVTNDI